MSVAVFVTGTDTGCGKTRVSCTLLHALAGSGLSVTGMKPVATGATRRDGLLVHEDVRALVECSNISIPRRFVNPYLFVPPCSPHIAAHQTAVTIDLEVIAEAFAACVARADAVVVEGAGGWCVPLGDELWMEHLAARLALPVLLVVGVRLGCINHAVASARVIRASGMRLLGWIANVIEADVYALDAVISTLDRCLPAPRLGTLGWAPRAQPAALAAQLTPCVDALRALPV